MVILANLSGIQDYLFEVRETGGKQAKSLRFRSLYIQLIAEAIAVRLLRAGGLADERLIFNAAGNIAIDAGGVSDEAVTNVHHEFRKIESWLRDETRGRLRINVILWGAGDKSIKDDFLGAVERMQLEKLRSWSSIAKNNGLWRPNELLAAMPPNPDAEEERDARLGQRVTDPNLRFVVFGDVAEEVSGPDEWDVAGLRCRFTPQKPDPSKWLPYRELSRLARYIPTSNNKPIEFVELAAKSGGAPMLAVLKADVDSLGKAITHGLENAPDLQPLKALSQRLERFFAQDLDHQLRHRKNLYTVFSGGDDVLLVGPWDAVLDFAGALRNDFQNEFQHDNLTLSAGIAIIKPKFPIRLAAEQVEDLLHAAKTRPAPRAEAPKDQCAAFGQIWKWEAHETLLNAAKQLAQWVREGVVQRSWLHTLLELALLRRGEQAGRDPTMQPAMATSRLAYHVGRNWPQKTDRDPDKRQAREWIERVIEEFDQFESTSHRDSVYLPTIVRYAMLASRNHDKGEDS